MMGPEDVSKKYQDNEESMVNVVFRARCGKLNAIHYISTTRKVLEENGWMEDLGYESPKDPRYHESRFTIEVDREIRSGYLSEFGEDIINQLYEYNL